LPLSTKLPLTVFVPITTVEVTPEVAPALVAAQANHSPMPAIAQLRKNPQFADYEFSGEGDTAEGPFG